MKFSCSLIYFTDILPSHNIVIALALLHEIRIIISRIPVSHDPAMISRHAGFIIH